MPWLYFFRKVGFFSVFGKEEEGGFLDHATTRKQSLHHIVFRLWQSKNSDTFSLKMKAILILSILLITIGLVMLGLGICLALFHFNRKYIFLFFAACLPPSCFNSPFFLKKSWMSRNTTQAAFFYQWWAVSCFVLGYCLLLSLFCKENLFHLFSVWYSKEFAPDGGCVFISWFFLSVCVCVCVCVCVPLFYFFSCSWEYEAKCFSISSW